MIIPIQIPTRTDRALEDLQSNEGQWDVEAIFMPRLIDARIGAPLDSIFWRGWYSTTSIRATGRTKQNSPVVVYAHLPNYFSNPDNITRAIEQGLVDYAGKMPPEEFQRLLDLDGSADELGNRLVWALDYQTLRDSSSGIIPVEQALKHPQTIPFLGGKERAQKYLERHEEVYGNKVGIWHYDDLCDEPLGRLLFVGDGYNNGLYGNIALDSYARFVGAQ